MTRHCMQCDAEVEDAGGYCLLGHPLRRTMETASLSDLKQEVEAAFASAQDEVRDTLTPLLEQAEAIPPRHEPEPVGAAAPAGYAASPVEARPAPTAPARQRTRTSPPPPPPARAKSKFESLWESMEGGPLDVHDPINAFAPPPRMDWGPERSARKSRALRRLRVSNA